MVAFWAIHFSNFVRVVTCWIHGNYFIYCFWMIGFRSWSWSWFQHDQGLSFDSRSVDQVKKNQNWLLDGMKCSLCSNQFGSCKGNVTWIFILRLITWPKVLWWCKFCFHRCHPPLSSSQLILILASTLVWSQQSISSFSKESTNMCSKAMSNTKCFVSWFWSPTNWWIPYNFVVLRYLRALR